MRLDFDDLAGGIVKDQNPHELPAGVWSNGENVRFIDGAAQKIRGQTPVFGTLSGAPYWLLPVQTATTVYWIYAGLTAVYATDGGSHADISGKTYSANASRLWNGGVLGGIPIINDGANAPQQWNPGLANNLSDLSNWPIGMSCRVLRFFKNFGIALWVDEGSGANPRLIRWSDPADPGAVPASRDYTDATNRAGRTELAETTDRLVDLVPVRDTGVIYKENSVWGMQFIGGNSVFRFFRIFESFGALAQRAIAAFYGKHIVLTDGDLVVHDTQNAQSIINHRMRRWLTNAIDTDNYTRSFIATNHDQKEHWICFPETGAEYSTKALIWKWDDNRFTIRDLPNVPHMGWGIVDPSATTDTFDAASGTFDTETDPFDQSQYNPSQRRLLMADYANSKLIYADDTYQFDGNNYLSALERLAWPLGRQGSDGQIQQDTDKLKYVKRLFPELEGGPVDFYVGVQDYIDAPVKWNGPYTFSPGDYKIDMRVTGRLIGIRIEDSADKPWRLKSLGIEYDFAGRR